MPTLVHIFQGKYSSSVVNVVKFPQSRTTNGDCGAFEQF